MYELEGLLTIKNNNKELVAIVYNDIAKRSQVFFSVKQMGIDDIKSLLEEQKNDTTTKDPQTNLPL